MTVFIDLDVTVSLELLLKNGLRVGAVQWD